MQKMLNVMDLNVSLTTIKKLYIVSGMTMLLFSYMCIGNYIQPDLISESNNLAFQTNYKPITNIVLTIKGR